MARRSPRRVCSTCGHKAPKVTHQGPPQGRDGAVVRLLENHPELADRYGTAQVLDAATRWSA